MSSPKDHVWILGYIDGYDAVHSVTAPAYGIHEDYFPQMAGRRWRAFIGSKQLREVKPELGMDSLYVLSDEDKILIDNHMTKKYGKEIETKTEPEMGL